MKMKMKMKKNSNSKKHHIIIEVDVRVRKRFRSYCKSQGVSMRTGLTALMRTAVRQDFPIQTRMKMGL